MGQCSQLLGCQMEPQELYGLHGVWLWKQIKNQCGISSMDRPRLILQPSWPISNAKCRPTFINRACNQSGPSPKIFINSTRKVTIVIDWTRIKKRSLDYLNFFARPEALHCSYMDDVLSISPFEKCKHYNLTTSIIRPCRCIHFVKRTRGVETLAIIATTAARFLYKQHLVEVCPANFL